MDHTMILLALGCAFGLFMAFGIGANDVANAMSTSVGSKVLTIGKAVMVAAIFEFAGAYLAGGEVTSTIRKGIVDSSMFASTPEILVYGMIASLLAAAIWLLIASWFGWPVSTTHTIVGAIVGFAAIGVGLDAVKWDKLGTIVSSWVVSPLLAGTLSFMIFTSVQRLVLDRENPLLHARRWVPVYMFLTGFILALVTLLKGLKHIGLEFTGLQAVGVAALIGLAVAVVGAIVIRRMKVNPEDDSRFRFTSVERVFAVLMVLTACGMAFAHGSNDVANAIGPLAAIVSVLETGVVGAKSATPTWILFVGAIGIVIGLLTFGRAVMRTVGEKITDLTPSKGFAAELAAGSTIVLASATGLPISTTHTLVGAVLGVGLARGIAALNLNVIRTIFISWVVTLPAGAFLSIMFFWMLKGAFS